MMSRTQNYPKTPKDNSNRNKHTKRRGEPPQRFEKEGGRKKRENHQ